MQLRLRLKKQLKKCSKEVAKVNTMNLNGKKKRRGIVYGRTAAKKKAIVQLTQDSADIQIFEGL